MDRGSPSPAIRVEQSSPLDSLVRRASSRRAKVAKLADALSVPYTPPRPITDYHDGVPPHSPILHTQFRGSIASTSALSNYDGGPHSVDSHTVGTWDTQNRQTEALRRPYQPSSTREVSMASVYSVDDAPSMYNSDTPAGIIADPRGPPTVVVSAEPEGDPTNFPTASPTATMSGRMPIRDSPGQSYRSYSRPAPPPIGSEEQKRQVLMRNASSYGDMPALARTASSVSEKLRPTMPQSQSASLSRSKSQQSVYSSYSYYPYEGQIPSPSGSGQHLSSTLPSPAIAVHPPSPPHSPQPSEAPASNPQTAQEFLQLGIAHHLANRLDESASCFEKSATIGGGCGMGMLMWGLAQRHGWGCRQSESKGFKWLRKAAEVAVDDLEGARGVNPGPIRSELVIAIYEVGQSFLRGWGVEKDKKMAVNYFRMASELGDPDAQQELAFCLLNGKGCKKDRKEAAKWYRAAVAQGVSDVGLAWIYKEKFL